MGGLPRRYISPRGLQHVERGGLGSHCPHLGLVLRKSLVMSTAVLLATEKTGQLVLLSILVRFLPFFDSIVSIIFTPNLKKKCCQNCKLKTTKIPSTCIRSTPGRDCVK